MGNISFGRYAHLRHVDHQVTNHFLLWITRQVYFQQQKYNATEYQAIRQ